MPWDGAKWIPYDELTGGTLVDMGAYDNTVTGGVFGIAILITLFLVLFVAGLRFQKDTETSLASAAFVCTISSYFMAALGWVLMEYAYGMTFILVASIAMLYRGK